MVERAFFRDMPPLKGVHLGVGRAGLPYRGRDDLMIASFEKPAAAAGIFTQSAFPAAPVIWSRAALKRSQGQARRLVVNAGNANAATGKAGARSAQAVARAGARLAGCPLHQVLLASTGVIGERLPPQPLIRALGAAEKNAQPHGWEKAARAILTTDTGPKAAWRRIGKGKNQPVLCGFAKGAAMIEPSMATMLAFLFTDATLSPQTAERLLKAGSAKSLNIISVDGETSTNDAAFLFATGEKPLPSLPAFREALEEVLSALARQIVEDGEGARKFIKVRVEGAPTRQAARSVARAIANSPLVKTAIGGEDANWGRIFMAIGKAGADVNEADLTIRIGGQALFRNGGACAIRAPRRLEAHLRGREIVIDAALGAGKMSAEIWTCDLTADYVRMNSAYRS